MELRLPFPPTPEHMADHAERAVEITRNVKDVELDFSVASLDEVDAILGEFHDAGDDPYRMGETLFLFGSYIGEVAVRNAGGSSVESSSAPALGGDWPIVALPIGRLVNPIGKAFKRVENGIGDSIPYFYSSMITAQP